MWVGLVYEHGSSVDWRSVDSEHNTPPPSPGCILPVQSYSAAETGAHWPAVVHKKRRPFVHPESDSTHLVVLFKDSLGWDNCGFVFVNRLATTFPPPPAPAAIRRAIHNTVTVLITEYKAEGAA
ncbi:hypothetical protein AAHC03_024460 [Spirometra sp. Aus1]